jgi:hypothetical protein
MDKYAEYDVRWVLWIYERFIHNILAQKSKTT